MQQIRLDGCREPSCSSFQLAEVHHLPCVYSCLTSCRVSVFKAHVRLRAVVYLETAPSRILLSLGAYFHVHVLTRLHSSGMLILDSQALGSARGSWRDEDCAELEKQVESRIFSIMTRRSICVKLQNLACMWQISNSTSGKNRHVDCDPWQCHKQTNASA